MKKIIIIVFVLSACAAGAQSFKEDFKKILSNYTDSTKAITYSMHIELFDQAKLSAPRQTMEAEFVLYKGYNKYRIGAEVNIIKPGLLFVLNEEEKIIVVKNKPAPIKAFETYEMLSENLLNRLKPKIHPLIAPAGQKGYMLVYPKQVADSASFFFDEKTYLLEKVTIYYSSSSHLNEDDEYRPMITVKLSNQKFGKPKMSDFSLDRYVHIEGKKVTPVLKYSGFKIINSL